MHSIGSQELCCNCCLLLQMIPVYTKGALTPAKGRCRKSLSVSGQYVVEFQGNPNSFPQNLHSLLVSLSHHCQLDRQHCQLDDHLNGVWVQLL